MSVPATTTPATTVEPAATPATTAPAAAPPAPAAAPALEDPAFMKERLDRHARTVLQSTLGVKTPEEAIAMKEKLAKLEADEKTRAQAAMSEQERTTAELTTEREARVRAETELAAEREDGKLMGVLHAKGIKNVAYAKFLVANARAENGGKPIDYDAKVTELLGDPQHRAAFGIVEPTAMPAPAGSPPASTSPATPGTAPKPPAAGGTAEGPKSAKDMTAAEWSAYKRAHSLS